MPKVSVVIPVYNASQYLRQCVDSLLAQTESDIEFVFVNDGSTDDSSKILESFSSDSRIRILNQQNSGVSAARNAGIRAAGGDYIGFVDADDFVAADMFDTMYRAATADDADIVISDFFAEQGKSTLRISFPFERKLLNRAEIRSVIFPYFIQKDWMNSACNKIFRRSLVINNNILFPPGVALGEDALFNMKAFNVAGKASYIDYCGYHYREVSGSATRNIKGKDYFKKVSDTYNFDYGSVFDHQLAPKEVERLKSIRLMDNVLSLIHLYLTSRASVWFRLSAVRSMISSPEVRKAIQSHYQELLEGRSSYNRFMLRGIRNRNIFAIYFATLYSKLRN